MRSLWGFPEVQLGAFLAPGGYLLAVLISYAKRNSNAHHPKVFVAPKKNPMPNAKSVMTFFAN